MARARLVDAVRGLPSEAEGGRTARLFAVIPGGLAGMVLAGRRVPASAPIESLAGVAFLGGVGGGLVLLCAVGLACRTLGFRWVAWVPLGVWGGILGVGVDVTVGRVWWSWQGMMPGWVLPAAGAAAGVVATYRLRAAPRELVPPNRAPHPNRRHGRFPGPRAPVCRRAGERGRPDGRAPPSRRAPARPPTRYNAGTSGTPRVPPQDSRRRGESSW